MPTDAYAPAAAGPGQHTHPWLTQQDVDKAQTVVRTTNHGRLDRVAVIHEDARLNCCGRLVSTLTPGATYPDA